MLYSEIESYFENENKINELLALYEPIFIDIDEIDEQLRNNEIQTMDQLDELIGKLSGLGNKCDMVATLADVHKIGEQGRLQYAKIQDLENAGKKPNMSQVKEEASYEVQYLRRVREIFRAYTQRADRALGACQSRLKKKERLTTKEE